jgi:hypothetical protein
MPAIQADMAYRSSELVNENSMRIKSEDAKGKKQTATEEFFACVPSRADRSFRRKRRKMQGREQIPLATMTTKANKGDDSTRLVRVLSRRRAKEKSMVEFPHGVRICQSAPKSVLIRRSCPNKTGQSVCIDL